MDRGGARSEMTVKTENCHLPQIKRLSSNHLKLHSSHLILNDSLDTYWSPSFPPSVGATRQPDAGGPSTGKGRPMLDIYLSYANFKICHFALLPALIWVRQGKVWLGTKMKLNPRVTLAVGQSSTFSCECIESSEQSSRPWAIIASEWSVSSLPAFSDGAAPRSGRWCRACYVWAWRASAWGWSGPGCCSLCWWCACSRALESSCILLCLGLTHWTWSTGGWTPWVEEVGVGRAWELVVVELCMGAACWSPGPHCPAPPLLGRAPAVCSCRTSHCSLAGGVSSTESRLWLVTTPGSDL